MSVRVPPAVRAVDPALAVAGGLLALVAVWPWAASGVVLLDWTDSVERGMIGLAEAAAVALWATRPGVSLQAPRRVFGVVFAVAAAGMLVSTAAAPSLAPAVVRTAEWGMHALFGLVAWSEASSGDAFAALWRRASLAGVAGVVASALVLWISLDLPELYNWGGAFPFVRGVRWVGTYGLLGVTLGAWVFLSSREPSVRARWAAAAWMCLGWLAVWWSGSRGAFGAALVGCAVVVVLCPRRASLAAWMGASALVGALLSTLVSVPRFKMGAAFLLTRTAHPDAASFDSGRSLLWRTTVEGWQSRPWVGLGPDGVLPHVAPNGSAHAHNTVVQALGELGLVGGVPFLALVALVSGAGLYRAWRTRDAYKTVAAGYVVAAMANGLLEGILYDPGTTLLVTAAAAVALARAAPPDRSRAVLPPDVSRGLRWAPAGIGAGACALSVVFGLHLAVLWAVWAPGPAGPDSLRWRLVRTFPSAPLLEPVAQWGRAWGDPARALDLARWGERQGRSPWHFYRLESLVLASEGDAPGSERAQRQADRTLAHARRYAPDWN